jgi:ubiquinone/menaquinone biosynthesis C-methylase UbiE/uncharacterized protein YbaR (Trm112 family)
MHSSLIDLLVCPACHGELTWKIMDRRSTQIETAVAFCTGCGCEYPLREGIGVFLTANLSREDLWEEVESQLSSHLQDHPDIERQLMNVPLHDLSPADQFFRAMILDERGAFEQAKTAFKSANTGLYSAEYLACSEAQITFILDQLTETEGPIIDLASGMGQLVERMVRELTQPVVATDFSLRVLRQDQKRFKHFGLDEKISLLACDARRMPFRDDSAGVLTTYLGLANIREAIDLLRELHRITAGKFLAITHFFPEDDPGNKRTIEELGLVDLLYQNRALKLFDQAGWQASVKNTRKGIAKPTPSGMILEGARIDSLPAAESILEWVSIIACRRDGIPT